MENPRPRSPFTSSMICGSELHIARPVSGSRERDFILFKLASVTVAVVVVEANEPSDLALTKRSIVGNKFCRDPPRMLYKINVASLNLGLPWALYCCIKGIIGLLLWSEMQPDVEQCRSGKEDPARRCSFRKPFERVEVILLTR